jgi:hypothetical protein
MSPNLYSGRFTVGTSVDATINALLELDIDVPPPTLTAFPYVHRLAPGRWLVVLAFFLGCIEGR